MNLTINGETKDLPPGATVRDLVEQMGLGKAAVAVEVNKRLVTRKQHEATKLHDGDEVEVVTLVGGG